jgi:hypothetical protein
VVLPATLAILISLSPVDATVSVVKPSFTRSRFGDPTVPVLGLHFLSFPSVDHCRTGESEWAGRVVDCLGIGGCPGGGEEVERTEELGNKGHSREQGRVRTYV